MISAALFTKLLLSAFAASALVFILGLVKPRTRRRIVDVLAVGLIGYVIVYNITNRPPAPQPSAFAQGVQLEPIKSIAVQESGRLKSFDSVARSHMRAVSGGHEVAGQDPAFTYLDILFRPEAYDHADVIRVKKKPIRQRIADHLAQVESVDMSVIETFRDTGLVSPALLKLPMIAALLDDMEKDLIRTAKPVDRIRGALARMRPGFLERFLRIIPPPQGDESDAWHTVDELWGSANMPADDVHAGFRRGGGVPGLDPQLSEQLTQSWASLAEAWKNEDAAAVNERLARFAALVRTVNPDIYPDLDKLKLENWYFRNYGMTWIWIVYLLAIIPLLMSVIYRWRGARIAGIALFVGAFGLHSLSLALRWYISGRIPNANMFEAITAATWLAAVVAFALEWCARRTPMRNVFFLGAAVGGMTATMCNHFMPATLSPDIDNIMPILHDVWLYIHTNVIILSYGLIAMAAVTALLYLRYRLGGGPPDYAAVGGAGSLILQAKGGKGGFLTGGRVTSGQVLDGATMVLMELSFVMLWAGLVMGAIWADHSWGRPWGWDPKEVFALNTFIVFLVLVHVRFKVRDKGLWTAILAVVGCGVMLFNWIVINFVITGLHSYA